MSSRVKMIKPGTAERYELPDFVLLINNLITLLTLNKRCDNCKRYWLYDDIVFNIMSHSYSFIFLRFNAVFVPDVGDQLYPQCPISYYFWIAMTSWGR